MSGLGKGTLVSATARLLASQNLRVTVIKIDPYFNHDAGLLSPYEHGEVFVLNDGGEVDLDLGNYERAIVSHLSSAHNITSGKIYGGFMELEKTGYYKGKTMQLIPHGVRYVIEKIEDCSRPNEDKYDVCIIEVGGTVGDFESGIFFEAIRELGLKKETQVISVMLSFVPELGPSKEHKTKPTQHGVKDMKVLGLQPDFIVCRSGSKISKENLKKIAFFANLSDEAVINCFNVSNQTDIPLLLAKQDFDYHLMKKLSLKRSDFTPVNLAFEYKNLVRLSILQRLKELNNPLRIGICGKYTSLEDSYYSILQAFDHCSLNLRRKIEIHFFEMSETESEQYDVKVDDMLVKPNKFWKRINSMDGILIPGGFGCRGMEMMIRVAEFCRKSKKPIFGICFGLQCMTIEYARNVVGIENAISLEQEESEEVENPDKVYVITLLKDSSEEILRKTMRLGLKKTLIKKGSIAEKIYGCLEVDERQRHRYEVNPALVVKLENGGLSFTGLAEESNLVDIIEIKDHPFYFGVQYHPEYLSNQFNPSRPFLGFVLAAAGQLDEVVNMTKEAIFKGIESIELPESKNINDLLEKLGMTLEFFINKKNDKLNVERNVSFEI